MGKAFEKQTKTIKDQVEKQINALETKSKETKPTEYGNYFLNESAEIRKFFESIDFHDLSYNFNDPNLPPMSFFEFKDPNHVFQSIHNDDIVLEDAGKNKENLNQI